MDNLKKTFNIGKIDYMGRGRKINPVEVKAELSYNEDGKPVFTASATVYNQTKTDFITCGQCLDKIASLTSDDTFHRIYKMWKRHHLNDMHAGTQEQEKALENCESKDYSDRCQCLKLVGLYEVEIDGKPYRYGQSWLYREIPSDDLKEIIALLS